MKLISCNITAFGNLINRQYTFKPGLNSILDDNGAGKTTLAEFIRCMLFGMTNSKKASGISERAHFQPFGETDSYGGSLTIEAGGKTYVITRNFNSRTQKKALSVIDGDGNAVDMQKWASPGEFLFKIDDDAFRRTVFFSNIISDPEAKGTDIINRKLDVIISDIDTLKLDKINKNFDNEIHELKAPKRSAKKGKIDLIISEIDECNQRIAEIEAEQKQLDLLYAEYNLNQLKQKEIADQINTANKLNQTLILWRSIDEYTEKIARLKAEAEVLRSRYPEVELTDSLIAKVSEMAVRLYNLRSTLNATTMPDTERLDQLAKIYGDGRFNAEKHAEITEKLQWCETESADIQRIQQIPIEGAELAKAFDWNPPDDDVTAKYQEMAREYKDNKNRIESLAAAAADRRQHSSRTVIILCCVAMLVGLALIIAGLVMPGAIFAGAAMIVALLAYINSLKTNGNSSNSIINDLVQRNAVLAPQLRGFYSRYGFYDDDFSAYATQLSAMVQRFIDYEKQLRARNETLCARREKLNMTQREVGMYISRFAITDFTLASLNTIESNHREYERLAQQKKAVDDRRADLNYEINILLHDIAKVTHFNIGALASDTALDAEIKRLHTCKIQLDNTLASITYFESEIARLKSENSLGERPDKLDEIDTEALSQSYIEITNRLKDSDNVIREIEDRYAQVPQMRAHIDDLQQQADELTEHLRIISLTKQYINDADNAIRERLVGPVKNNYSRYMRQLIPRLADDIVMDTDYRIRFKTADVARDNAHLSQGERTCLELSLRAALIDNMFKTEKPMLVFDDPFTELDETNFTKAAQMLNDLAGDYQILYFCCHRSRMC